MIRGHGQFAARFIPGAGFGAFPCVLGARIVFPFDIIQVQSVVSDGGDINGNTYDHILFEVTLDFLTAGIEQLNRISVIRSLHGCVFGQPLGGWGNDQSNILRILRDVCRTTGYGELGSIRQASRKIDARIKGNAGSFGYREVGLLQNNCNIFRTIGLPQIDIYISFGEIEDFNVGRIEFRVLSANFPDRPRRHANGEISICISQSLRFQSIISPCVDQSVGKRIVTVILDRATYEVVGGRLNQLEGYRTRILVRLQAVFLNRGIEVTKLPEFFAQKDSDFIPASGKNRNGEVSVVIGLDLIPILR